MCRYVHNACFIINVFVMMCAGPLWDRNHSLTNKCWCDITWNRHNRAHHWTQQGKGLNGMNTFDSVQQAKVKTLLQLHLVSKLTDRWCIGWMLKSLFCFRFKSAQELELFAFSETWHCNMWGLLALRNVKFARWQNWCTLAVFSSCRLFSVPLKLLLVPNCQNCRPPYPPTLLCRAVHGWASCASPLGWRNRGVPHKISRPVSWHSKEASGCFHFFDLFTNSFFWC